MKTESSSTTLSIENKVIKTDSTNSLSNINEEIKINTNNSSINRW